MEKTLDLNQSVYSLCKQYPELKQLLKDAGFDQITKPGMLATAGRFMTIKKGAAMKKLDIAKIAALLEADGYIIQNFQEEGDI